MTTADSPFHVLLNIRIDWSEMDLFGHVNNVMFFKYIQASRVNYWEQVGLMRHFDTGKTGPILASASCQFRKPLYFPGNIIVQTRTAWIKQSSFCLQHQILNENNEIAAEAEDIIVMYDFARHVKVPFPADIKDTIHILEQKTF